MSRKMLFALAGVAVLLAGFPAWKADAAAADRSEQSDTSRA